MPAAVAVPAIVGAVGVGASVYGSTQTNKAARRGAASQEQSAQAAIEEQRRQFDEMNRLMAPFREAGITSTKGLLDFAQSPETSDIYNLRQKEGQTQLERALRARGLFGSGVGIEQSMKLNENLTAEEAARKIGIMQMLSQQGAGVSGQMGSGALQTGGNIGSYLQGIGQSQANAQYQIGQNRSGLFGDIAKGTGSIMGWLSKNNKYGSSDEIGDSWGVMQQIPTENTLTGTHNTYDPYGLNAGY